MIGNVVYYSDLAAHTTAGLDVRTGDAVFSFHDGAFTPAVADDHAIFLVGHGAIYQMLPGANKKKSKPKKAHRPAARRASQVPSCHQAPPPCQAPPQGEALAGLDSLARVAAYALSQW